MNGDGQPGQDAVALVHDLAGLAVQQLRGAHDHGAEGLGDRLVAQADTEDRRARLGRGPHHRHGHAGAGRRAGAGGEQHPGDVEVGAARRR